HSRDDCRRPEARAVTSDHAVMEIPDVLPSELTSVESISQPKPSVLVVEDNETARRQIQVFLEHNTGIRVDTAANGKDALRAVGETPYSVVLTDLRMPRVDGLQLLEEVQKLPSPAAVIITTGFGTIDQAVQAMRLGATDFLTKPVNLEHLKMLVERALR